MALDGIQRCGEVAGDGSPINFPMMEKRQKHRFSRLPAKKILERRRNYDRNIKSEVWMEEPD